MQYPYWYFQPSLSPSGSVTLHAQHRHDLDSATCDACGCIKKVKVYVGAPTCYREGEGDASPTFPSLSSTSKQQVQGGVEVLGPYRRGRDVSPQR